MLPAELRFGGLWVLWRCRAQMLQQSSPAIFGQGIASMVIDHFGWLNVETVRIDSSRVIGAILLLTGVILIQRR